MTISISVEFEDLEKVNYFQGQIKKAISLYPEHSNLLFIYNTELRFNEEISYRPEGVDNLAGFDFHDLKWPVFAFCAFFASKVGKKDEDGNNYFYFDDEKLSFQQTNAKIPFSLISVG